MTAKRNAAEPIETIAPAAKSVPTYVPGSHTNRVRAEHDTRRVELLARDEVLDDEIRTRQAERDDINEALRLMSSPASNVVELRAQQDATAAQ